jgi:hypothetical protein
LTVVIKGASDVFALLVGLGIFIVHANAADCYRASQAIGGMLQCLYPLTKKP